MRVRSLSSISNLQRRRVFTLCRLLRTNKFLSNWESIKNAIISHKLSFCVLGIVWFCYKKGYVKVFNNLRFSRFIYKIKWQFFFKFNRFQSNRVDFFGLFLKEVPNKEFGGSIRVVLHWESIILFCAKAWFWYMDETHWTFCFNPRNNWDNFGI
jgi:hypothetical protein